MKIGDLVKWIGYPGSSMPPEMTGPKEYGIIVDAYLIAGYDRYTVAWGDGTLADRIYPQTIEVITHANFRQTPDVD